MSKYETHKGRSHGDYQAAAIYCYLSLARQLEDLWDHYFQTVTGISHNGPADGMSA